MCHMYFILSLEITISDSLSLHCNFPRILTLFLFYLLSKCLYLLQVAFYFLKERVLNFLLFSTCYHLIYEAQDWFEVISLFVLEKTIPSSLVKYIYFFLFLGGWVNIFFTGFLLFDSPTVQWDGFRAVSVQSDDHHSGRQFNELYERNFDPNTDPSIIYFDNLHPGDLGPMDKEIVLTKYMCKFQLICSNCRIMCNCSSWWWDCSLQLWGWFLITDHSPSCSCVYFSCYLEHLRPCWWHLRWSRMRTRTVSSWTRWIKLRG